MQYKFENTIKITGDKNKQIEYFEFKDFERNDMYLDLISDYIKGLTNTSFQSNLQQNSSRTLVSHLEINIDPEFEEENFEAFPLGGVRGRPSQSAHAPQVGRYSYFQNRSQTSLEKKS